MSDEGLIQRLISALTLVAEKMAERKRLPAVLTPQMVARELSCSVSKVRQMIREGELASVWVGGRLGVPSPEIERYRSGDPSAERTQEQEAPTAISLGHRRARGVDFRAEAEKARALTKKKRR